MKVWILSTCIPEDCKPCLPHVFSDEGKARAAFEEAMREEWVHNGPYDDDGEQKAFPTGDPELANRMMAADGDQWGEYELTCHEID